MCQIYVTSILNGPYNSLLVFDTEIILPCSLFIILHYIVFLSLHNVRQDSGQVELKLENQRSIFQMLSEGVVDRIVLVADGTVDEESELGDLVHVLDGHQLKGNLQDVIIYISEHGSI